MYNVYSTCISTNLNACSMYWMKFHRIVTAGHGVAACSGLVVRLVSLLLSSLAVSLSSINSTSEVNWTEFGSMLFIRNISGTR